MEGLSAERSQLRAKLSESEEQVFTLESQLKRLQSRISVRL